MCIRDSPQAGVAGGVFRQHLAGMVRRAVVDHDQFHVRRLLREYRFERARQQMSVVVRRNDDADQGFTGCLLYTSRCV